MLQLVLRVSALGALGLGVAAYGIDRWNWGHFAEGRIMGGEKGAPMHLISSSFGLFQAWPSR